MSETIFNKVINPCSVKENGALLPVFIKIEYSQKGDKKNLSLSGVIAPMSNGNARGACGQIRDEFFGDKGFRSYQDEDIKYNQGWDKESFLKLLSIWNAWHLNDLRAGCEHQRAEGVLLKPCPVCGYKYGSAWLYEPVPHVVITWLEFLPETKVKPAWL